MLRVFSFFVLVFIVGGCASLSGRIELADKAAAQSGMVRSLVKTDDFTFTVYKKINKAGDSVTIYIEGDGYARAERGRLSVNPTPKSNLVITLSSLDASSNVVYLARPCQYTPFELNKIACSNKFWSGSRYSETVIESMSRAVDSIAKEAGAAKINLVGYSGGGAVAILLAARRSDVATIRTVAGNLDTVAVNNYHKVDQMKDSLNPTDYISKISSIPQYHFAGGDDKVVPPFVAREFAGRLGSCAQISVIDGATHFAGWKEVWKSLLLRPVTCAQKRSE